MFTGIVQTRATVHSIVPQDLGVRLVIDTGNWQPDHAQPIALGDSICVSGVCLTVADIQPRKLGFDVIAQTLRMTTLGSLSPGSVVNLEPSVTAATPMGGHFVQGHVEGVGTFTNIQASQDEWRITVEPPFELMPCIIPKGSVAVDGVSMTVADVSPTTFDLALIPTTLRLTSLGLAKEGGKVNIETDIVSRTIVHQLTVMGYARKPVPSHEQAVTDALLRESGFIKG
ncbi:MAG: riboflavin synthase [Phycisphaera sp.]|nr:riboflavin synthase [Phycisphaera sp.]